MDKRVNCVPHYTFHNEILLFCLLVWLVWFLNILLNFEGEGKFQYQNVNVRGHGHKWDGDARCEIHKKKTKLNKRLKKLSN